MKKTKRIALTAAGLLALSLAACEAEEVEPGAETETPTEAALPEDEEAVESQWTDEDEERFQEEYDQASAHLADADTAELCDAEQEAVSNGDADAMHQIYEDFASEVGVPYGDERNPVDNGAVAALVDHCS